MRIFFIKHILVCVLFFTSVATQAQLFAGIEIGSKGVKMSVLDVDNIKKGDYVVSSFWTENVGIARGIAIDGNLAKEDIDNAVAVVATNYEKLKKEYKVDENNIYIVGSSGVAMAENKQELIDAVKKSINKDLEYIDANSEAKMLLRGCVPPVDYTDAMVLDIGGGNTKGGYVDTRNGDVLVFFPISLNYGSITLTEAVIKNTKDKSIEEYNAKSFGFLPILRTQINAMYNSRPSVLEKGKVFMSGGAVWAFYTLMNGAAKKPFSEFKLEDVIYYDQVLKNNFTRYEELAKTDKEIAKVLKTYSQKHLISGVNILLACLEALPNINDKKLYFAKEGQIAWLVSYIADHSKKVKKIY